MKSTFKTIEQLIAEEDTFILSIPNNLGINLCNVKGIEFNRQEDDQLIDMKIVFIPKVVREWPSYRYDSAPLQSKEFFSDKWYIREDLIPEPFKADRHLGSSNYMLRLGNCFNSETEALSKCNAIRALMGAPLLSGSR